MAVTEDITQAEPENPIRKRLPYTVNRAIDYASFLFVQRVTGFRVSDTPEFDAESLAYFRERLAAAGSYLEFGSGGSTVLAARQGLPFVCVETDPVFLRAVEDKIKAEGRHDAAKQTYIHANIGLTEAWGTPLRRSRTPAQIARWSRYPAAPWETMADLPGPYLILVDGRFRVACALMAGKFLQGREGEILFDDHRNRPDYHPVQRHLELQRHVGRMAVYKPRADIDPTAIDADIELYCRDWR
ncbi:MAG: hypothetical protein R3C16_03320 [Hyphomonadaceae bacterium]